MTSNELRKEIYQDKDCFPWSTEESTSDFLGALVKMVEAKLVLELGTWKGSTTLVLADAVGDRGLVHTVDIKDNTNGRLSKYENRIRIRQSINDSRNVVTLPVDFVFLDTQHSELHIMEEVMNFWKMLKPGGIIAFHDVFSFAGVKTAVSELEKKGLIKSFTLPTQPNMATGAINGLALAIKI